MLLGGCILEADAEELVWSAPAGQPISGSAEDFELLEGFVAAEANQCKDKKKQQQLDRVSSRIQALLAGVED